MRKHPLTNGYVYHIFTKSIAGFKVFRNNKDYQRMLELLKFYRVKNPPTRFSAYVEIKDKANFIKTFVREDELLVLIYAYCLMPTHIHLLLEQVCDNGITVFMKRVLDSYTRYFNLKIKRKGPLWQSKFKNVLVKDDSQMLHLTRYIHLNPTSDGLVEKPEDWKYSSYLEYISLQNIKLCNTDKLLLNDYSSDDYKKFVEDRKDYQKTLSKIKDILFF